MEEMSAGNVEEPGPGDCWYCSMKDVATGKAMGNGDVEHLRNHMAERYYVPSLILRAIERFPVSIMAKTWLGMTWDGNKDAKSEWVSRIGKEQVGKSLYRYMKEQFGFQA
jgi:hypothetical protein